MTEAVSARKIKTTPFRMSFPQLLTPKEETNDKGEKTGKKSYQLSMLFPPGTDLAPLKVALKAAMQEKHGDDVSKWPDLRHKPVDVIRDFARYNASRKKPLPGDWAGWTLVRANAQESHPPGVVGPTKAANGKFPDVRDMREVYSGRWARASIDAFYFAVKGGGVSFGLKNVQLLKHDTNFSGAVSAPEGDFDDASKDWAGDDRTAGAPDQFEKGDPGPTGNDWDN